MSVHLCQSRSSNPPCSKTCSALPRCARCSTMPPPCGAMWKPKWRWPACRAGWASFRPRPPARSRPAPTPPPSIWTSCGWRPRSSAIRSCRWCTSYPGCAARKANTCTGAPPRKTSWTPPRCCRCAMPWQSSTTTWRPWTASWTRWRCGIAIRRWPDARTCSTPCRLPSATRPPSGC
ncbi:hypothetical protein D9M68_526150 [compost metagenome]